MCQSSTEIRLPGNMDRRSRGTLFPCIQTDGKNLTVMKNTVKIQEKEIVVGTNGRECSIFKMIPALRDIQGEQCSETFRRRHTKQKKNEKDDTLVLPDITDSVLKRKYNRTVESKTNRKVSTQTKKFGRGLDALPEI